MDDIWDSFSELCDYDAAARLLSRLCPEFVKNDAEASLGSPESFACLLYRNPGLFDRVERASSSRNIAEKIWKECLTSARPPQIDSSLSRLHEIPFILKDFAPSLNNLITGKAEELFWSLDTTKRDTTTEELYLGSFSRYGKPPLRFHELGSFRKKAVLNERIQRLFFKGQDTFLVNSSATGKTRLLYEGLCQRWGLYLTARADYGEARTLHTTLLSKVSRQSALVKGLPKASTLGFRALLAHNREIAARCFSAALLAHLLVFKEFLTTAHSTDGKVEDRQKQRWLFAQVECKLFNDLDPFEDILHAFDLEPLDVVDKQIFAVLKAIQPLLPISVTKDGFFIVIDEANVAVEEIWYSNYNDTGPYPALEDIICVWKDRLASLEGVPVTFIVAGTEIPQRCFSPSSSTWSSWRWTSDTGSFNDPEIQRKYLSSFLPTGFMETEKGKALIGRVWDWCRPRHRFTATFVSMLLVDRLENPHGVLDLYIKTLTGFTPTDGADYVTKEGQSSVDPGVKSITTLIKGYPLVRGTTHEVIMHYIISGKHPPCFGIDRIDIVSSGVGQFKDQDMTEIALDQPFPTIAAAVWLSKRSHYKENPRSLTSFEDFCSYFERRWPNGDSYSSAGYLALFLAHAFTNQDHCHLSAILTIPSAPRWLDRHQHLQAQLVVLQKTKDGTIQEMVMTRSSLLPGAPPLGYAASTADDVVAWLRHERTGAFCICPRECRAELIFVLRRDSQYLWVVLRTARKESGTTFDADDLYPELDRLSVQNLFPGSDAMSETGEAISERLLDAFKALPNGLAPPRQLSMLRVIATFPSEPELRRKRIQGSPVAVLKTSTFKAVTEPLSGKTLIETLVLSMHGKRSSQYADDEWKTITAPPSQLQKRKSQTSSESSSKSPRTSTFNRS